MASVTLFLHIKDSNVKIPITINSNDIDKDILLSSKLELINDKHLNVKNGTGAESYVYVIKTGKNIYKIGYGKKDDRLDEASRWTLNPELILCTPGGYHLEQWLHHVFQHKRYKDSKGKELFNLSENDMTRIQEFFIKLRLANKHITGNRCFNCKSIPNIQSDFCDKCKSTSHTSLILGLEVCFFIKSFSPIFLTSKV